MKIVFSDHALGKIKARELEKSLAIKTIKNPDFIRPSYSFGEEKYKKFGRNHLKVVTIIENNEIVVITVHWVAKIKQK